MKKNLILSFLSTQLFIFSPKTYSDTKINENIFKNNVEASEDNSTNNQQSQTSNNLPKKKKFLRILANSCAKTVEKIVKETIQKEVVHLLSQVPKLTEKLIAHMEKKRIIASAEFDIEKDYMSFIDELVSFETNKKIVKKDSDIFDVYKRIKTYEDKKALIHKIIESDYGDICLYKAVEIIYNTLPDSLSLYLKNIYFGNQIW